MLFRIVSFNVNGLRSFSRFLQQKNMKFNEYLKNHLKATILCVQESRGSKSDLIEFHTLNDYLAFSSANKSNTGKYGVYTFIHKDFHCTGKSDKLEEFTQFEGEGRYILTKHGNFNILNCYFPFVSETEYRSSEDKHKIKVQKAMAFYNSVNNFIENHPNTILLGDFNAVYSIKDSYLYQKEFTRIKEKEIFNERIFNNQKNDKKYFSSIETKNFDECFRSENQQKQEKDENILKNSNSNIDPFHKGRYIKPITSPIELPYFFENVKYLTNYLFEIPNREWLYRFIHEKRYIDTYRSFSNKEEVYTCWNQFLNLRRVNLGTRIDLILVPNNMKYFLTSSDLLHHEYGSDHCPVYADLNMKIEEKGKNILKQKNNLLSFFKTK